VSPLSKTARCHLRFPRDWSSVSPAMTYGEVDGSRKFCEFLRSRRALNFV
jgi:hypothetical protein